MANAQCLFTVHSISRFLVSLFTKATSVRVVCMISSRFNCRFTTAVDLNQSINFHLLDGIQSTTADTDAKVVYRNLIDPLSRVSHLAQKAANTYIPILTYKNFYLFNIRQMP